MEERYSTGDSVNVSEVKSISDIYLSSIIKKAYINYGFVSIMIAGDQGAGKTTLALKILHRVYDGDWSKVIEYTFLSPDDVLSTFDKSFSKGERIPAILIDDVAIAFDKYSWSNKSNILFAKIFNLARSLTSGIVFTSVETSDLYKWVRDKVMYSIWVTRLSESESRYKVYRRVHPPHMDSYIKLVAMGRLRLDDIPSWVREKYEERRRQIVNSLLQEAISALREENRRREIERQIESVNLEDLLELR